MGREYHVSVTGNDRNDGSMGRPFATIQRAADIAAPGDVVTVHGGEAGKRRQQRVLPYHLSGG